MKKVFVLLLSVVILLTSLLACNGESEKKDLLIVTPDGAPSLALSKLMYEENDLGAKSVTYKVVPSTDITSYVIRKEADAAILPLNAATKVAGEDYKMAGVVTHGNLYVVSSSEINSVNDLKGKRVGAIGQGQVPDLTMKAILSANGIAYDVYNDDAGMDANTVYFDYYTSGSLLIPVLKSNTASIGILPEPAVTNLKIKAPAYSVKLNVQVLYDDTEKSYPQAVLLVKNDLLTKSSYDKLIKAFTETENWLTENIQSAINAINSHLEEGMVASFTQTTTSDTIINCNVKFVGAQASKTSVLNYINRIQSIDSKAINQVTDAFFI